MFVAQMRDVEPSEHDQLPGLTLTCRYCWWFNGSFQTHCLLPLFQWLGHTPSCKKVEHLWLLKSHCVR